MNKKETLEIRKQFVKDGNVITRICSCYVDAEKEIKFKSKEAFYALPEEDAFKYYTIFRQTLSGSIGKNLLNLDFPTSMEGEGTAHDFLMKLRESKLKDDELTDQFFDRVISSYDYGQNYYIILIHMTYDVPGKATDGTEMFDASDNVYNCIMCSICPVNLTKEGLGYNETSGRIEDRVRDWMVEAPAKGFLFPVFNDRAADIHSVLYYSKNPEELQPVLVAELFGTDIPLSAKSQKDTFQAVISETLGDNCEYDVVKNIHENLNEMLEETKDNPEPLMLSKYEMKNLMEKSGVPDEKLVQFDTQFEEIAGEKASLVATNIAATKSFNIDTPNISIKVKPEYADLIERKYIEGRYCLVIPIEDKIEINGISVNPAAPSPSDTEEKDDAVKPIELQ